MSTNNSRRNFLKTASLGSLMAMSIPEIVAAAYAPTKEKKISLSKEDIILFQGDSITDAHRKKDDAAANSPAALGTS